jgi:hypothetical protein
VRLLSRIVSMMHEMRSRAYAARFEDFFAGILPNSFRSSSLARSNLDFCAALSCLPARLMWKLSMDIAD